ncbi:DUF3301 domain-containing protein [Francisella tularensis]|uniref:DUF3301 domain-containing protein n=3 Tax=Francisella tularensis TaxID=263 RepID=A0AAW3D617_FRATU|nr:DUF3301 domain-containing protein [Francisella tularensis]ABO47179.1 hypothetical protein FTW_1442 [Francisella tularensis subsp. tularensis WY96-3418]ADA78257.1 hypothetical protein NE061598_03250 [Francisella tularensis subsp. tularensis NE061598]AJI62992.1 hypothetical protein CH65_99 [Francisella tularensis subsp. tularensis]AJI69787.1 hypothetical protein BZ14_258 [Francisella tularensis subsp. tularensis SCHU S4]AJI71836.1 hypothetical protein CH69_386 [Francisella tularensis subsp. t
MSIALYTLISLAGCFFAWRNFMKNKEYAISIAERAAVKYNLDLLDDTVCLRKLNLWFENKRLVFYRVYSFDYNTQSSDDRYRGYIVIRNGKLNDVVVSEFEKADIINESIISEQATNTSSCKSAHNIINFDE